MLEYLDLLHSYYSTEAPRSYRTSVSQGQRTFYIKGECVIAEDIVNFLCLEAEPLSVTEREGYICLLTSDSYEYRFLPGNGGGEYQGTWELVTTPLRMIDYYL